MDLTSLRQARARIRRQYIEWFNDSQKEVNKLQKTLNSYSRVDLITGDAIGGNSTNFDRLYKEATNRHTDYRQAFGEGFGEGNLYGRGFKWEVIDPDQPALPRGIIAPGRHYTSARALADTISKDAENKGLIPAEFKSRTRFRGHIEREANRVEDSGQSFPIKLRNGKVITVRGVLSPK